MFRYTITKYDEIVPCYTALTAFAGGWGEEVSYTVRLVLDELATNVIKHGRCKAVISAEIECGCLFLTVRGECKFCPKSIPPIAQEAECGRGVFLVRQVCEELRYEEEGKVAVAKIKL